MQELLERISRIECLSVPKGHYDRDRATRRFGNIASESSTCWSVPCSHLFKAPASREQIDTAESQLGFRVPDSYKCFLSMSDGAELFRRPVPSLVQSAPTLWIPRFSLFGCDELVRVNKLLFERFRFHYADDPEFKGTSTLNYIAFCDADNNNYQALYTSRATNDSFVFLLFRELLCRPYSDLDKDYYQVISDSFNSWLTLVAASGGWQGRGWIED